MCLGGADNILSRSTADGKSPITIIIVSNSEPCAELCIDCRCERGLVTGSDLAPTDVCRRYRARSPRHGATRPSRSTRRSRRQRRPNGRPRAPPPPTRRRRSRGAVRRPESKAGGSLRPPLPYSVGIPRSALHRSKWLEYATEGDAERVSSMFCREMWQIATLWVCIHARIGGRGVAKVTSHK